MIQVVLLSRSCSSYREESNVGYIYGLGTCIETLCVKMYRDGFEV